MSPAAGSNNETSSVAIFFDIIPVVSFVVYALISVIGILGNGIVIVVYAFNRAMRDSTNTLIINLACSDLMFVVLCVPFTSVLYWTQQWPFPSYWCSVVSYLQYASAYSSVWTLAMMAFDRFLAVVFPMRSIPWRSVRNTTAACFIVWAIILVMNVPLLTIFRKHLYQHNGANHSTCLYVAVYKQTASNAEVRLFYISFVFWAYAVPLTAIGVLYVMMLRNLWRPLPHMMNRRPAPDAMRYKRRVTMMIGVVSLTFAVCWLPQQLRFLLIAINYPTLDQMTAISFCFQLAAQVLAYANSCMNPVLYGILSSNWRKAVHNFLNIAAGKPPKYQLRRGTRGIIAINNFYDQPSNRISRSASCASGPALFPTARPSVRRTVAQLQSRMGRWSTADAPELTTTANGQLQDTGGHLMVPHSYPFLRTQPPSPCGKIEAQLTVHIPVTETDDGASATIDAVDYV